MKKIYSLLVLALILFLNVQGQVAGDFRSKAAGPGNWNDFNAWERYDGTAWLAATSGQLPTATSAVEIQMAHTMIINATGLTSGNLTVNGSLYYVASPASALTVSGNVTVTATGSFTSPTSGTVVTHALNIGGSTATGVGGNLVVDGIFNMNVFQTAGVVVTFYGTPGNTISGAGSTINFYSIVVNKGTSNASVLDVTSVITCADATSTAGLRLSVTIGTFKLSSASLLKPFYGGVQPTQAVNARLWINNAAAIIQGVGAGTAAGPGGTLTFGGLLQIDAGTLSYGNGTSSISIFGNFSMSSVNATLNVYGYFYSGNASTYTISAGNINIYPQVGANYVGPIYFSQMGLFHFGGSALNFTGGTLTIVDANLAVSSGSYYAPYSINIAGGTNNLSGSTIRFGDGISDLDGSVNGFTINSGTALGNVIVNNNPASVKTTRFVKLLTNATIGGNLTINSGSANQFLVNGWMLTAKGNIANSGTFTFDVVAPGNTTSGLTFTGTTQQVVSGAGTFSTNVNNLVINNTSGASPSVDLQIPLSVSNSLTLTKGILGSSNSSVFTIGKAGYTTFNLNRSGGSLAGPPTFALGGVGTFNVTYSAPSPAASITTGFELPAATPITTFTINNASGVTLDKAVSCTSLAFTAGILTTTAINSVTVTGTAVTSISGGGAAAYVNGPLTRTLPNNAVAANYKFPVGKTAYRLIEYSAITTGGTGTATFTAEAFDAGPYAGTAGTGLSTINTDKYWSLSASLGSVTITSSAVRLTDAGLTPTNRMGQSDNATGTYNSVGGNVAGGTTIASTTPIDYSTIGTGTYFRIGQASAFAAGIYAIGPQVSYAGYAGTFASMTAAVVAVTSVPLPGPVIFEFQGDYLPSVETFPISMTTNIASNAISTITFRPAPGVGSVINFSAAGSVLTNAGADYVTFDGRNGGTGTNRFIQFTNTTTAGATVTLSSDAQYNNILYCTLKGGTTTVSTGILTINAASAGNNFYTIDNCIFDASGSANNCIYATGIGSDAIITNNNFFDYRNGAGINLASGSNNAVIDNNNCYQTIAYNGFAGTTYGIYVNGGNNVRISNNNIGGSGPGITGTWTVSATSPAAYNFSGITATLGTTSKIYNNKIQNFDWKSTPATWTGINGSGTVNIGTDGANFIGSSTGNDNIRITYYNTNGAATVNGILISGASVTVSNNNIGSITTLLSGATGIGSSIYGIVTSATNAIITNNIIGSATTPQSINAANQSTTGSVQNVYGINITSNGTLNISGNTMANLYSGMTFSSASAGLLRGIKGPGAGGGSITIASNNIFSLSTPQTMTGAISAGSSFHNIVGIDLNSTNASGTSITGNNIYNLSNTAASGAVSVLGIYCQSGANSVFDKNYIHSLSAVSGTAILTGINLNYGGPSTIRNNIIRLGYDFAGNSITSNAQINGIIKNSGNGFPCYAYFNTVYIGGSGVTAGPAATYCFLVSLHVTEDLRDNIFTNTRSGGGTNYAIKVNATGVAPSGLTLNYNDYYVNGTGAMFGYYNGNIADLPGWKTAVGLDANSLSLDPQFISLTDVHPANLTMDNVGQTISGITTDFSGVIRTVPPDIGAYEFNNAPILSGPLTVCTGSAGNVYTALAGQSNYVWVVSAGGTITSGGTSADNTATVTWTTAGAQTVSVNYNLYPTPTVLNVSVNLVLPVSVSIVSDFTTVCDGTSVNFTATPTNGGSTPVYQWYNGATPVGTNSPTYSYIPANGDVISVSLTSSETCQTGSPATSNLITMTVNPLLPVSVTIVSDFTTVCEGTMVNFTATPTNEGLTPVYQWYNGATPVGTNTPTYSYIPVNGDLISVVMTSSETCKSGSPATSNTIPITVNPVLPVSVSIAADFTTVCEGAIVNFTATPTNGGLTPSFQWHNGVTPVGSNSPAYSYVPINGDVISVVMTSSETCQSGGPATSNLITMTVNPILPVSVSIVADLTTVCEGTTVNFTATPTHGGLAPSFQWYNGVTPVGSNSPAYSYVPLNGDVISVVMTSSETCQSGGPATSNLITLTVNPVLPVSVSIAADFTTVCAGTTVNFTATPTNEGLTPVYQWYNGATQVGTNSPAFSYVPANGDVISVVLTSSLACQTGSPVTSNTIPITVSPVLPVSVSIAADFTTVCDGTTVNFSATPTNQGLTPAYQWYNGVVPVGTNSPAFSYIPANGDVISVVLTSSETCQSGGPATSNSLTMTVNPVLPVSVSIAADFTTVCAGTTVNFTANPTNGGSTPVYQWYNGVTPVGTNSSTFSYIPANGDVISVVLTSSLACQTGSPATSNTIPLTVNPVLPVSVSIAADFTTVCDGATVNFTATPTNGGLTPSYQWYKGATPVGTNSPAFSYIPTNGDIISVVMTSSLACQSGGPATSNLITMTVNPYPAAAGSISGPATACINSVGIVYSVGVIANATSYSWTVPAGMTITSGATTNSITVNFGPTAFSGTITVRGVNACGNGPLSPAFSVSGVTVPGAHGNISGPNNVCKGTSGVVYSIAPVLYATGYVWSVPTGATIVNGQNTVSITVNFSPTASSGKIQVYAYNTCGNGPVNPSLNVNVNAVPTAPVITYDPAKNKLTSNQSSNNQWCLNGVAIPGATGKNYTPLQTGTYTDIIIKNGCSSAPSNSIYVLLAKSFAVNEDSGEQTGTELLVYPNPNHGQFTYEITLAEEETLSLEIYSNLGQRVYEAHNLQGNIGNLSGTIDLQQWPEGIYILHLQGNKTSILRKIVINK